jgi:hypothetical protein
VPTRRRTPPADDGRLRRSGSWAGLRQDDPVDVLDDRVRGASWRFAAHVTNVETGATWIEVVGGRRGDERRRSFREDQVFPYGSVRRSGPTAASLADAPRLDL